MSTVRTVPHPENLTVGERYFMSYSDHVSKAKTAGEYRGFVCEHGTLWLLILVRGEHGPRQIPYKSVLSMSKVEG